MGNLKFGTYSPTALYMGASGSTKAYLGTTEVFSGGTSPYTNLSYIYAGNTSNTYDLSINYVLTVNSKIRLKADIRGGNSIIWIGRQETYRFFAPNLGSLGYFDIAGDSSGNRLSFNKTTLGVNNGSYADIMLTNHSVYNAETQTGVTGTTIANMPSLDAFYVRLSHLNVYGIEVWENDIKTLNLIPVERNEDNKCGLYDTLSGTFYTSDNFVIIGVI